jgi:hypothetical protein
MQKGYIYEANGAWHVRFRLNGKQVSRKLATTTTNIARREVSVHWLMNFLTL